MSGYREIARQFVRPMGVSAPAARAASLATQAENVEAEDPEWAARLEAQAVQARGLVLDLVAGAVHQQFPGLSEERWTTGRSASPARSCATPTRPSVACVRR